MNFFENENIYNPQNSELQREKDKLKQFILGNPKKQGEPEENKPTTKLKQISHFQIEKTLGEGTFGKVMMGTHMITQQKVAIKVLEKSKITNQQDIDMITREIKILKKIRHPYVIQLYQIIETNDELFLIMEHADAGELFEYIVRKVRVDDVNAALFLKMILEGVEYLHKNGVCHRDLKPENLLLEEKTNSLKIIDFGLSNMYSGDQTLRTACGSPCYAAPEMIAGKDYNGIQVDIWSCGVILYAMCCGYLPFEDPDTNKLYSKIMKGQYTIPKDIDPDATDLIKQILNINPVQRFTLDQIRSHPWFVTNNAKARCLVPQSSRMRLGTFSGLDQSTVDTPAKDIKSELKINGNIILEMASNYKIPTNPTKRNQNGGNPEEAESIKIEDTLRDLANNKHNDLTTTYYLLHKNWQIGHQNAQNSDLSELITLTTSNYSQIAFKLQNKLELKNQSPERAKNMIKLDKSKLKLAESASLVIKSPVTAFQQKQQDSRHLKTKSKVVQVDQIAKEGNSNRNLYVTTPKKPINGRQAIETNSRLHSVQARRNYYEVKTTIQSSAKRAEANEESSNLYSFRQERREHNASNTQNTNSVVTQITGNSAQNKVQQEMKKMEPLSKQRKQTSLVDKNKLSSGYYTGIQKSFGLQNANQKFNETAQLSNRMKKTNFSRYKDQTTKVKTNKNSNVSSPSYFRNPKQNEHMNDMLGTDRKVTASINFDQKPGHRNQSQNPKNSAYGLKGNSRLDINEPSSQIPRVSRDPSNHSRISGTNVSYQSSYSAIMGNIMKFKNKRKEEIGDNGIIGVQRVPGSSLKRQPLNKTMMSVTVGQRLSSMTPNPQDAVLKQSRIPAVYTSLKKENMNQLSSRQNPRGMGSQTSRNKVSSSFQVRPSFKGLTTSKRTVKLVQNQKVMKTVNIDLNEVGERNFVNRNNMKGAYEESVSQTQPNDLQNESDCRSDIRVSIVSNKTVNNTKSHPHNFKPKTFGLKGRSIGNDMLVTNSLKTQNMSLYSATHKNLKKIGQRNQAGIGKPLIPYVGEPSGDKQVLYQTQKLQLTSASFSQPGQLTERKMNSSNLTTTSSYMPTKDSSRIAIFQRKRNSANVSPISAKILTQFQGVSTISRPMTTFESSRKQIAPFKPAISQKVNPSTMPSLKSVLVASGSLQSNFVKPSSLVQTGALQGPRRIQGHTLSLPGSLSASKPKKQTLSKLKGSQMKNIIEEPYEQ